MSGCRAQRVADVAGRKSPQVLQRRFRYAEPMALLIQPVAQRSRSGGVTPLPRIFDEGIDVQTGFALDDEIKRLEQVVSSARQVIPIEEVHQSTFERRYIDCETLPVDDGYSLSRGVMARGTDEAAGEVGCLDESGLAASDQLNFARRSCRAAMQLERRPVGDDGAETQAGCSQEPIEARRPRSSALRNGREHATRNPADVADAEVILQQLRDCTVTRVAATSFGEFGAPESRRRGEEGRG